MYSITHGKVTFEEMYQIIKTYTRQDKNVKYKLAVGTDSQNFSYTKVPVTIGIHKIVNNVGKGGIFFSEVKKVNKITNTKQRIMFETNLSIEYAQKLQNRFEEDGVFCDIAIHVDVGYNGPSSKYIDEIRGWVKSCGFICIIKPDAYMASSVANRLSK